MPRFWLWLLLCAGSSAAALQPTSTTLSLTSGTLVYGTTLTVRAQVNATAGSITFAVDGQSAKPVSLDSNSGATLQLTPAAGTHTVSATFSGSDTYQPSTAAPLTLTISKATPIVGISGGPAQIGQSVTVTATVAIPGFGQVNGGTISFSPAPQCGAVPVVYGVATCTIAFGSVGSFPVYATFSGDGNTNGASANFTLAVGKAVASIYIASTPLSPVWATPAGANVLVLGASNAPAPTGTVTFSAAGSPLAVVALGSDGRAALSTLWAVGSYTISAVYGGDANYQPSGAVTASFTVSKAPTVLTVSSDPAQIGQPVALHASVALASGTGPITGTIDFAIGGKAVSGCTGIPVSGGTASCPTSFPQTGALTLSGTFSGDANTRGSSGSATLSVNKAVPGIYLAQSPAAPTFGQTVTLGCLVLGAPGLPAPAGTVTFTVGGKAVATQPVGSDGHAYWSTTWLAGDSLVTASYSGDANYQAPAPASLTLTVTRAAAALAVSSDPAQLGQPVTLRASVALPSGTGTITGTVDFSLSGKPVSGCTGIPLTAGAASCQYSFPQLGTFTLSGSFSGDANTLPATATAVVTVMKAVPAIYLTQTPAIPVYGQAVTLDSLLLGAASLPPPTGTVTFTDGGAPLSSQAIASDGRAAFTLPFTVGLHSLVASYSGDTNYQPVASTVVGITVSPAATSISLNAVLGGPFTAVVTATPPATGTPTGLVSFRSGATLLGTVPVTASGSAVLATSGATGSITAAYSGDANFAASVSGPATVSPPAGITLASSAPSAVFGQPLTLTATLAAQTGSVQFTDGSAPLGSATISAGIASLPVSLAAGTHAITASWAGNAPWAAASAQLIQTINQAATSLSLTSSGAALSASVSVTAPGAGMPTGNVQFLDGSTLALLATVPLTGGTAGVPLPAGAGSIVAVYAGDANFLGATSPTLHLLTATNAASYLPGNIAPDELVTIFGPNLSGVQTVRITDSTGAGSTASIVFASSSQASIVMPPDVAGGPATLSLAGASATLSLSASIAAIAPGLFTADGSGQGAPAAQVIATNPDGTQSAPVAATLPIDLSGGPVYLVLYGTGLRHTVNPVTCSIGGRQAQVLYAGPQGSMPGLDQVNLIIPPSLKGAGAVTLQLSADTLPANPVTLTLR